MTFDPTDPRVWLIVIVGTWMIFVAWELFAITRHVNKVDDLANAIHLDLTEAEVEIAALKAERASRLPGQRVHTFTMPAVQPDSDAHRYGRHARTGQESSLPSLGTTPLP